MVKLALVNLYLHGFKEPQIYEYDTLSDEKRWDEDYDVILANPPFMTPKGGIAPHKRFSVQARRSEVLFVDYIAEHLKIGGRAGIIVPEGIIFQASNAYKNLRKNLIENWGLWAVISLPSGVFQPYSGVKTSILILDKALAKHNDEILFVKVENDGFDLGAQRRKIDKNDLPIALEVLKNWKENKLADNISQSMILYVKKSKIAENGEYNLTGDRYRKAIDYSKVKWNMVELGEVAEYINGFAFKPKDWTDTGLPIIRIQNLTGSSKSINKTDKKDVPEKYIVEDEDLLISWSATIGFYIWNGGKAYLNQHIFKVLPKENLSKKYFYYLGNNITEEIKKQVHGNTMTHITKGTFNSIQIPLPPLEVQEQIVAEIEQYQKVIDGAKQVVDNWKPSFRIDPEWEMVKFEKVCILEYGKGLPKNERKGGEYPVMGSNGRCGYHNEYLIEGPSIIVGRKGSAGEVVWEDKNNYPIDTTYFVSLVNPNKTNLKFIYCVLKNMNLSDLKGGAGIPGLNRNDVYSKYKIPLPPLEVQEQIVSEIEVEQEIVTANKELMEKMEKKIDAKIGEVWGEK